MAFLRTPGIDALYSGVTNRTPAGLLQLLAEAIQSAGGRRFQILVEEGNVVQRRDIELERGRRELRERIGDLERKALLAQAANDGDDGDDGMRGDHGDSFLDGGGSTHLSHISLKPHRHKHASAWTGEIRKRCVAKTSRHRKTERAACSRTARLQIFAGMFSRRGKKPPPFDVNTRGACLSALFGLIRNFSPVERLAIDRDVGGIEHLLQRHHLGVVACEGGLELIDHALAQRLPSTGPIFIRKGTRASHRRPRPCRRPVQFDRTRIETA